MNLLDALIVVRNGSLFSATARTRRGATARKVVEKKIQQLLRKKAWRENTPGSVPVHMADPTFQYPIPDDVLVAALRAVISSIERAAAVDFSIPSRVRLLAEMEAAKDALAELPSNEEQLIKS
jgi:hypothetical protein